jgi:lipoprotein NlpI
MWRAGWGIVVIASAISDSFAAQDVEPAVLLHDAASAAREGKLIEATRLATQAIQADPNERGGYQLRAGLYAAAGEHKRAIADYDQLLKLDPQLAEAYDQRGSQRFMMGQIKQSIDDFDRFLALKPQQEPHHWKRGISYYYAGRYDDGRRQFEGYQTVDGNDVENAVWRYLCMARSLGVQAARDAMLKIKQDPRVPMMEVYALYSGKASGEDVLAAARAGSPTPEAINARLFYAHLYLGLFYEAAGDGRLAREHIGAAVEHKIGHYMWNVAEVHAELLKTAAGPP